MKNKVCFDEENFILEEILYDPQTSGGLLASVASDDIENILMILTKQDLLVM